MGGEGQLTRDEIQDIINIANDIAEHTRLGKGIPTVLDFCIIQ